MPALREILKSRFYNPQRTSIYNRKLGFYQVFSGVKCDFFVIFFAIGFIGQKPLFWLRNIIWRSVFLLLAQPVHRRLVVG